MKQNKKPLLLIALLALCAVLALGILSAATGKNLFAPLIDGLSQLFGEAEITDLPSPTDSPKTTPDTPVQETTPPPATEPDTPTTEQLDRDGSYSSKEEVALYLHLYGKLPSNFITKAEAEALGWTGGGLDSVAPGKAIGGDRFGNYEGLLPKKSGRVYYECDIDTLHASRRGAKRIVFSNDGLIFYTEDHYESFEQLY